MRKARRVAAIMLGCVMLLGGTLTVNAETYPTIMPCPYCSYNSGVRESMIPYGTCRLCDHERLLYRCGHCSNNFYLCALGHTTTY